MNELHCTGCMKLVNQSHKCVAKRFTLIDKKVLVKHQTQSKGMTEAIERLTRVEAKLDIILAAMSKKKLGN